jgi:hypothetical protein
MSQTQGGLHVIQRFMTNQTGLRRSLAAQLCLEMGPFPINLGNPGCHKPTKLGDDLWSLHIVYVTTHKVMVMTWGWWLWHWVDPTLYMILYDIYIYWFNGRLKPTQPLIHLTLHWLMILVRIPTHIIYVYIYICIIWYTFTWCWYTAFGRSRRTAGPFLDDGLQWRQRRGPGFWASLGGQPAGFGWVIEIQHVEETLRNMGNDGFFMFFLGEMMDLWEFWSR